MSIIVSETVRDRVRCTRYEWGPDFLVRSHLTHGVQVQYSITQVSNRIFTIKCRQSSSATATQFATSLTLCIHSLKKFVRMFSAKKSYFMQITRFLSHNNESIYLSLESVLIVDDLKQSPMPL